jgi:hypothetical protein
MQQDAQMYQMQQEENQYEEFEVEKQFAETAAANAILEDDDKIPSLEHYQTTKNGGGNHAENNGEQDDANSNESGSGALGSDEHLELMEYQFYLPPTKWRAKLYILNGNGSWDDQGTGEFQIIREGG